MGILIGTIIALIIAFAVANDASKRGMNALGWGIGVFLLLIFFLPLYFIVRKPILINNEQESENQYFQELIEKGGGEGDPIVIYDKCPACGTKISNNDKQCPDCGLNLN